MLDFKELDVSGNDFEILIRELLYNMGLEVYWSGKGADGGKDLLCIEKPLSNFKTVEKRWVVQCKHNAHSRKSVSLNDLEDIVGVCDEHNATGYMLACSTYPSSALVKRFEQIQNNKNITTAFWDYRTIERELLKPGNWNLVNMFFPKSMNNSKWRISTIAPDFWHANYDGNIFYMSARLGTNYNNFFEDIENVINMIKKVKVLKGCILRLRGAYFDEKNANCKLYIDYLIPEGDDKDENFLYSTVVRQFEKYGTIGGISYEFDILTYRYNRHSDHFNVDHKDYYFPYIEIFKEGGIRYRNYIYANPINNTEITEENIENDFRIFCDSWNRFKFIHVLNIKNAKIEFIDQFSEHFAWNNIFSNADYAVDNFFDVQIYFECDDFNKLKDIINCIPQSVDKHFELKKKYIVLPGYGLDEKEDSIYTINFSIHPALIVSKVQYRKLMNQYLREVSQALNSIQV